MIKIKKSLACRSQTHPIPDHILYPACRMLGGLRSNLCHRQSMMIGLSGGLSYQKKTRIDRGKFCEYRYQYVCKYLVEDDLEQRISTEVLPPGMGAHRDGNG